MRKYSTGLKCLLATLVLGLLIGCGQETVTFPSVVSTIAANGAANVLVANTVSATFNMPMTAGSITTSSFLLTGPGGAVSGSVAYSGLTATFTPAAALANGTLYTGTITNAASDIGGTHMATNYTWSFTTITPAPFVVSTLPANTATGVPVTQALTATFNEAMACSTLASPATTFTLTGPGNSTVAGTVTCAGAVATFLPLAALSFNTVYTATITNGAQDLAGTPLVATHVWTFTTITPPPAVIATIPTNTATGVPVTQALTATFSEAMACSTLASPATTFTLTGPGNSTVAGDVTCAGDVATFMPLAALAFNTVYTATITNGAQDLAGTPLAATHVWTFTTITPPPAVIATVPTNTATGVAVTQNLTATFNEAMICSTLASPANTFALTGPGSATVAGTVNCSGSVATFTPAADLAFNTVYTATITTAAQDLAGTPMAAAYIWTFRTLPAPTPPTVISTVPANVATAVPTNQALSATFSIAMNPATIDGATFTLNVTGGASVPGVVTYVPGGSVATFTPSAALAPNTQYSATITTGAENLAGTALSANYVWTFTTAAAPVVIPPTVISTIPTSGAVNVPVNQIVNATFSTAMNPATINSTTFTLTGPGVTSVPGLVAYAAVGNTLTFTPTSNLVPSTIYTATIKVGAQDLAGVGLASNYVWTFTTGTVVVATPPEIVSTVPANAATNVALNQAVSATFTEAMNPLTLTTGTFEVTGPGGIVVPGTLSYDAINFISTFTPTLPFASGSIYNVTITDGATNLAGIPLGTTGAPDPWSFTTGTVVVAPPIVLGPTISLFGGFGGGAGMTNVGIETLINGDIGTTGASTTMTGFYDESVAAVAGVYPCSYTVTPLNMGLVNGTIYTAPPPPSGACPNEGTGPFTQPGTTFYIATQALAEATTAYNTLQGLPSTGVLAPEVGNTTIYPGVYKNATAVLITAGPLTLDAQGDPNAYWVFQIGTSLTVGGTSPESVILTNGAQASNVFWAVGSAATINGAGGGTFAGTIISQAGISVSTAGLTTITTIDGRLIALGASTTLVNTVINVP